MTTRDGITAIEIWTYREPSFGSLDLTGYGVEAVDGSIGKIDEASNDVGASYVVVDTGPWIFGRRVMLPAGLIGSVDTDDEKVYVNATKEQVKDSPELDEDAGSDDPYRGELGSYYSEGGAGWRAF